MNLPYKPRLSALEIFDIYYFMTQPSFKSNLKVLVQEALGTTLTPFEVYGKPSIQFCNCPLSELINQGCQCGGV